MRTNVSSRRIRVLLNASCFTVLAGVLAGCSSGFERFDYLSAATPQPSNVSNPYPAGVDPTTTASVSGSSGLRPVSNVGLKPVPQGVYHTPEPTYVAPAAQVQPVAPTYQASQAYQPVRQQLSNYKSASVPQYTKPVSRSWSADSVIKSTKIGNPRIKNVVKPVVEKAATYVPPKPSPQEVYIAPQGTDPLNTASVKAAASSAVTNAASNVAQARQDGWQKTGGTTISTRPGETLYNLSKRYGVPVQAIQKANGLSSTDTLQAGQQILIPNYVFSPTSAISAPDNNPETRAARASTGYIGQADGAVAVPVRRTYHQAAVSPETGLTTDSNQRRYQPKSHVVPQKEESAPDYSIVTGTVSSGNAIHAVQSGDTLSKISAQTGVSVRHIMEANQLKNSTIRLGQKLVIPGASNAAPAAQPVIQQAVVKPVTQPKPVQTQSISTIKSEAPAPASTGISQFRWPVSGRIIEDFSSSSGGKKNDGIDISVPEGTAVKAAENGVVIYAGDEISVYGKLILVRHADGWVSAYAHNRNFEVQKGEQVRRGQIIARSGRTGEADRPKLHFELRKNSNPVDPKKYLSKV